MAESITSMANSSGGDLTSDAVSSIASTVFRDRWLIRLIKAEPPTSAATW
jgi:hypothetical protein